MDSKRAAEVLRQALPLLRQANVQQALDLGAQALEAWSWVERTKATVEPMGGGWTAEMIDSGGRWWVGNGLTPLAAVADAMEQEEHGNGNKS